MSEKFGFVYLWYDRKHKRFYIGSHWGTFDDGYICSSSWMKQAYKHRPQDFKRRILKVISTNRKDLLLEEQRWLSMIKPEELTSKNSTNAKRNTRVRYYNIVIRADHLWHADAEKRLKVGEKISTAKKGKKIGPCSAEKAQKISETKKNKFAERREQFGYALTPEHHEKIKTINLGKKHTEEWKKEASQRLKMQWENGERNHLRKPPKPKIPRGAKLKELWSDPEWKEKQKQRLKEGAKKRWINKKMEIVTCPHCSKTGGKPIMMRYHFDNCKLADRDQLPDAKPLTIDYESGAIVKHLPI